MKDNQILKNSSFHSTEPTPNRRIPKPISKPATPRSHTSKSPKKNSKIDLLFKIAARSSQINSVKNSVLSQSSSTGKIKPKLNDLEQTTAEESALQPELKKFRKLDHF